MPERSKHTALYYTGTHRTLCIYIPKLRGTGYLKSPFGGHHNNQKLYDLYAETIELGGFDVFDIDGYVAIPCDPHDEEFSEGVMKAIVSIFPQVEDYIEIKKEEFYKILGL